MKKVRIALAMLLTVATLLMPMQAFAAENVSSVRLYNACCNAEGLFQFAGMQIVDLANARIEAIIAESVALGQTTNDPAILSGIAASMQFRTCAVSGAAQTAAALCGVTTTCDWVEVTIGADSNAVTVYVDPLRVVLV